MGGDFALVALGVSELLGGVSSTPLGEQGTERVPTAFTY